MNLEHDFALWNDHRDTEALARVFDATASRLLLLGVHLCKTKERAEDLVQATYLAAMSRSATWDRTRPVWPWLATILTNEVRMRARRDTRRGVHQREVTKVELDREQDPALLAETRKTIDLVIEAIHVARWFVRSGGDTCPATAQARDRSSLRHSRRDPLAPDVNPRSLSKKPAEAEAGIFR